MILFCLPFAGGSAHYYMKWRKYLPNGIKLSPIEYAGRGLRIKEQPYQSFENAVDDIAEYISRNIKSTPYAIYGHSLGGLLAFELNHKLLEKGVTPPCHSFYSGISAPNMYKTTVENSYNCQMMIS